MAKATTRGEIAPPIAPEPPADPTAVTDFDRHADLVEFTMAGGDLTAADAAHVRLVRGEVRSVAVTGARLRGSTLVDVLFVDCEFSGADLHDSSLVRVEFRNCRMVGINFSEAELRHVRFTDCKLDDANLRLARLDHVWVDSSSLREADAYEAALVAVRFDTCDLTRVGLAKATIDGLDLRGSTIDALGGAAGLRRVRIGVDQVVPFATSVFAETGIQID